MMFRINYYSKFLTCARYRYGLNKNDLFSLDVKGPKSKFNIPLMFYSSKSKNDDKKVCDTNKIDDKGQITSHPISNEPKNSNSTDPNFRLKSCKPVDINPCRPPPIGSPKIPSIHDVSKPDYMSELPKPEGCWEEADKASRRKGRTILWFGILFTAVTLGTLYSIGIFDIDDKKKLKKKIETIVPTKKRTVVKNPASSQDIPNEVPYLLIGGGTASFAAFRAIKSADPTAKVLVITNESFNPYMRPPLSKEMWFNDDKESVQKLIFKQWNGSERSLFYEPEDFYIDCKELMKNPNGGVAIARGWNVSKIDVIDKIAYLEDGSTIQYDKCLLATGATPRLSTVFQIAAADKNLEDRIKIFRNVYDFEEVADLFENSKRIAIVGGGFLGSELACSMARKDKKHQKEIYQLFREGGNMGKILPEYLSYWTTEKVKAEGVDVMTNTEVLGVKSTGKDLELKLNNGKTLEVDYVIVAVGVEPNTELAKDSDLEVDPDLGGFLVNTELQARSDLYIAGDCACFYDSKLGRRRIEHHDNAVVTGRLAGENMTGARKPYIHQSMFWSDLGPDVGYEAIGVVDASLPTVAVFAKATEQDNPKAAVTASDDGIRSNEEVPEDCDKNLSEEEKNKLQIQRKEKSLPDAAKGEDFGKGVIFYLRDDIVVGIVLWNVFNRMSVARQVLKDQKKYDDLNEVAKLFNIHDE